MGEDYLCLLQDIQIVKVVQRCNDATFIGVYSAVVYKDIYIYSSGHFVQYRSDTRREVK